MDKKLTFVVLAILASATLFMYGPTDNAALDKTLYESWKVAHGFEFDGVEDNYRFKIFMQNWE